MTRASCKLSRQLRNERKPHISCKISKPEHMTQQSLDWDFSTSNRRNVRAFDHTTANILENSLPIVTQQDTKLQAWINCRATISPTPPKKNSCLAVWLQKVPHKSWIKVMNHKNFQSHTSQTRRKEKRRSPEKLEPEPVLLVKPAWP